MGDTRPRLLILGGAGYIGARLAAAFADDFEVLATARRFSPARQTWLDALAARGVQGVCFDSLSDDRLPEGRFDVLLNLAMPGAEEAVGDPGAARTRADRLASQVLAAAREARLGTIIHFSSFQVYGPPVRPVYAEDEPATPQHPYAVAHLHCEQRLRELGSGRLAILRPTNIVAAPANPDLGPQAKLIFLSLCAEAARQGSITLHNDGLSHRDFLGVDDVVTAIRALLAAESLPSVSNLSMGASLRLDSLATLIADEFRALTGRAASVTFGQGTDAYRSAFNVSNANLRRLGWTPSADLAPEVAKTLRFFMESA